MKNDLELIKTSIEKLRADLIATNMALQCVLTAMPPDAQQQALKALAQLSVLREQHGGAAQTPAEQAAMQLIAQAVERAYQGLQAAHKLRLNKLNQQPLGGAKP